MYHYSQEDNTNVVVILYVEKRCRYLMKTKTYHKYCNIDAWFCSIEHHEHVETVIFMYLHFSGNHKLLASSVDPDVIVYLNNLICIYTAYGRNNPGRTGHRGERVSGAKRPGTIQIQVWD